MWNFFRLAISFSLSQRKHVGRKRKKYVVGRVIVNDELSFAFHSMDQFQFIYIFFQTIVQEMKETLIPMGNSAHYKNN